jgi:signal transduction histidine kinase
MRSALSRHLAGETPSFDAEYRVRGANGADTWFEARGSVIERSAAGEPLRMIGTVSDVSVRKSIEHALAASLSQLEERKRQVDTLNVQLARRAVDAETAVRAKDAFLRNVTHEFRTPLNHISGAANLLARSPLDEKQLKWLTMILDGSRNLLRRVDTTIDVARLEAGALVIEAVDFSLPAVLDQVIGLVLHRARDKGLKLSLEAPSDIPPVLSGDPTRLTQMLLNYLDNAITFTEEGSIVVRALRLRSDEQVVTLRFEVTDTGPGIDPELRKTLFAPFMQGDTSMTRTYSGLGVGLAITRQLARLMAGDAGVESAPGKGSTFWITASFSCAVSRTR